MIGETTSSLEPRRTVDHREEVMGTVVTIDVEVDDASAQWQSYPRIAHARAILQRADALFSTWKQNSPISRIRRGEIGSDEAPSEVGVPTQHTVRSIEKGTSKMSRCQVILYWSPMVVPW